MKKLITLAIIAAAVGAQAQVFVYNSRDGQAATVAGTWLAAGATDSNWWGDQVTLAGTERNVSLFETVIQFNPATGDTNPFNFSFDLKFSTVSGTTVNSTPFFSASFTAAPVAGTAATALLFGFPITGVTAPDTFVYSMRVHRLTGSNTGAIAMQAHNSAPTVGSSDPTFFWQQDATTNAWSQLQFTGGNANFRTRITASAVPEPASMAALGLGALALIRRRRSKKA